MPTSKRTSAQQVFIMVQPKSVWTHVGKQMRDQRLALDLSAVDVALQGGPSSKSVLKHERGLIQRTDLLAKHLLVLHLLLPDVLRLACGERTPVSPDAMQVARIYDRVREDAQDLLLRMARALDAPGQPGR